MNKVVFIALALMCAAVLAACAGGAPAVSVVSATQNPAAGEDGAGAGETGGAEGDQNAEPQQTAAPDAGTAAESPLKAVYRDMDASGLMPEMMELPETMALDLFGFDSSYYSDAVFYLSYDSMLADEVVLVAANDEAAADFVEEMLFARLEAKAEEAQGYSPEQYAIITACSVYRNGNIVALIVGPGADDLTAVFARSF